MQKKNTGKGAVDKLFTSSRHRVNKETLEAIFAAVNPTVCHWQDVFVDLKEAKVYIHCLLGGKVTSVGRILQSLQRTRFSCMKEEGSNLCAEDGVEL
eukprot:1925747-Ditylum_brightwellii.AAC.1